VPVQPAGEQQSAARTPLAPRPAPPTADPTAPPGNGARVVPRPGAATGTSTSGGTRHDETPDDRTAPAGGPTGADEHDRHGQGQGHGHAQGQGHTGTADRADSASGSADKQGEATRGR